MVTCIKNQWTKFAGTNFNSELKDQMRVSGPLVLDAMLTFLMSPITLAFGGRLGESNLAAVGLSLSVMNVLGISLAYGLGTAADTYFAQIYGSPVKKNLGVALQKSLVFLTLCSLPCVGLFLNVEKLLLLIGQQPDVARYSGIYLLICIPGLLAFFVYASLSRYLKCQNILWPVLFITAAGNIMNIIYQSIFLVVLDYGVIGSATALSLSYVSIVLFITIYILVTRVYVNTWDGWSMQFLEGWDSFLKLGLSGMVMVCLEWWSYEVGVILSGLLGTVQQGTQAITLTLGGLMYSLPMGIGIGASIRVGQFLGGSEPEKAKSSSNASLFLIGITGLLNSILLLALKDYIPLLFSNIPEVVTLMSSILPTLAIYRIFDSAAGVSFGILRGCGRQRIGSVVVLFCYIIALSVGLSLMLATKLEIQGYWIGTAIGVGIEGIVAVIIVTKTDWDKQACDAAERTSFQSNSQRGDSDTQLVMYTLDETYSITDNSSRKIEVNYKSLGLVISGLISSLIIGVMFRLFI